MLQRPTKVCCHGAPWHVDPFLRNGRVDACVIGRQWTSPQEAELSQKGHHHENGKAKSRVTQKIFNEGWSGGISPCWIALMTEAPRAWCNGIGRYTLLRWALNQDDDVWLSMRGARHQQKYGSCGLPGDSFPHGYYHPPLMCEACIRTYGA